MKNFKIGNKEVLFELLNCSERQVQDAINDKSSCYKRSIVSKKRGIRHIYEINSEHIIYSLQKRINSILSKGLLFPECVCGFRKNRSFFDFLAPHLSVNAKRYYLRLDISNFFDSIQIIDVKEAINYYIANDITKDERSKILDTFIDIVSLNDHIVQGAITSPIISNLVFRSLDIRIERYCKKFNIIYSRYADDMLFSGSVSYIHSYRFINAIKSIIFDKNFKLNHDKTLKYRDQISINGYVVGTDIHLSRKKFKELNAIIYKLNSKKTAIRNNKNNTCNTINKLAGYRSFLILTSRYLSDEQKKQKLENKIRTIEKLITELKQKL